MTDLPEIAWLLFPLFFALAWVASCAAIASMGGWRALAESYPAQAGLPGQRFRWRSLRMRRGASYNGCVHLVSSPMGLGLSVMRLFRVGHAPIFVPWDEVRAERGRFWLAPVITLRFTRRPEVPVHLPRRLGEKVIAAARGAVRVQKAA